MFESWYATWCLRYALQKDNFTDENNLVDVVNTIGIDAVEFENSLNLHESIKKFGNSKGF